MHNITVKNNFILVLSLFLLLHGFTTPSWSISYVYDDLNRLTEVHYDSSDWIEYKYDEVGNITDKIPHGNVVTITPTMNAGGSISPPGTVSFFSASDGSFTVQPAGGYIIANVTVDGTAKGSTLSGPYTVPFASVAHTLAVDFEPSQDIITFSAGAHGSLTGTSPQTVNYSGSTTAVAAVPATGYHFVNWTGTGGFATTTSNPLTVSNVTSVQNITANFAINQYAITFIAGSNGTLVGPTSQTVNYLGSTTAVTAIPYNGYQLANWTGTGGFSTTSNNPLIDSNVAAVQNITANFAVSQCSKLPVRIARATPVYYSSLQSAYNAAVNGDTIQAQALVFSENFLANNAISVSLNGGFSCDYSTNQAVSIIKGAPQTTAGSLTLGNFIISN